MVKKLFCEDPHLTQLDTSIVSVNNNEVTVKETILYAFSGGQESDDGTIGNRRVLQAGKEGKEIVYTLEANHGFSKGESVMMNIDWNRRYRLMRLHFAAEIVLELMYRNLESIQKIGAHIAEDKSRIDFIWGENISAVFPLLQQQAHTLIEANYDITSAFSNEEDERRYWEIKGFGRVPCGGTHIKKTGEIGPLELKRKNIGKGKERIEIYIS
ncbi:alanyl-tRNA editing protein [Bacillus sp. 165]|uniref:alanyl-tRNA editing protein n=1 Tax=Bacillus sp. 165 TaxID=1529117 RepID=UPI001ADA64B2|nr:alanyl-tRNA editing protein [Bacillus sp. 165]MBO9128984.1 alanyl-tRNA editing protein [Bacillus sp. 165]